VDSHPEEKKWAGQLLTNVYKLYQFNRNWPSRSSTDGVLLSLHSKPLFLLFKLLQQLPVLSFCKHQISMLDGVRSNAHGQMPNIYGFIRSKAPYVICPPLVKHVSPLREMCVTLFIGRFFVLPKTKTFAPGSISNSPLAIMDP